MRKTEHPTSTKQSVFSNPKPSLMLGSTKVHQGGSKSKSGTLFCVSWCLSKWKKFQLNFINVEKKPKTIKSLLFCLLMRKYQFFLHILNVSSRQEDPFELKPFPLNQACRDTSLEYKQDALWNTNKTIFEQKMAF